MQKHVSWLTYYFPHSIRIIGLKNTCPNVRIADQITSVITVPITMKTSVTTWPPNTHDHIPSPTDYRRTTTNLDI